MRDALFFCARIAVACGLLLAAHGSLAQQLEASGAAELRARHAALQPQLDNNVFQGRLHLESEDGPGSSRGEVHAVLAHPFAVVKAALSDPSHWCDVMILHLNTKLCRQRVRDGAVALDVRVGRKHDQPLTETQQVLFRWSAASVTAEYMTVQLDAAQGPFDTHDYRILLEAVPLDSDRTLMRMGYSVSYGASSRLALRIYLATLARNKVGFSMVPAGAGEEPRFVDGVRGLVERNTMRYYFAIESYLGSLSEPPPSQLGSRLSAWFDATEKHPRQLREIDRREYLEMKRSEYQRQQTAQ